MKKIYVLTLVLIAMNTVNAQAPSYGWANFIGGNYADYVTGIAVGPDGNPVVTGSFSGDSITVGNTTLYNLYNQTDIFIVKYDGDGNALWVQSGGGSAAASFANVVSVGLSADANNNLYYTGDYNDSVYFGNNVILPDEPSNQLENSFTVKYNSAGVAQWAQRVKGAFGEATAVDQQGNVAMSGIFAGSDSIVFNDTTIINPDTNDDVSFIIKYDANGNKLWQQLVDGAVFYTLATDKAGYLYASGYMSADSAVFGAYTLYNADPAGGTVDIFVVRYSPTGNVLWAQDFGNVGDDYVNAITISAGNQINITGNFNSPELDFGNTALTNPIGSDFTFVARLDSSGSPLWATGAELDNSLAVSTDAQGNVYISGDYLDTTVIVGPDTLSNPDFEDMFVIKYDADGNVVWAQTTNCTGAVFGCLVANDAQGNTYIATDFMDSTLQLGSTVLTPQPGAINVAVAKLNTGVPTAVENKKINPGDIQVFPNPTTGSVYFAGATTGSTIEIYNLLGERLYSTTAENEMQMLNLNGAAKGMYIYRVTGNNVPVQTGKIVIE